MKLEIDTTEKTIKIVGAANLSEFIDRVKNIVGDDFPEYTIVSQVEVYRTTDPIMPSYPVYPSPWGIPPIYPTVTYDGSNVLCTCRA